MLPQGGEGGEGGRSGESSGDDGGSEGDSRGAVGDEGEADAALQQGGPHAAAQAAASISGQTADLAVPRANRTSQVSRPHFWSHEGVPSPRSTAGQASGRPDAAGSPPSPVSPSSPSSSSVGGREGAGGADGDGREGTGALGGGCDGADGEAGKGSLGGGEGEAYAILQQGGPHCGHSALISGQKLVPPSNRSAQVAMPHFWSHDGVASPGLTAGQPSGGSEPRAR